MFYESKPAFASASVRLCPVARAWPRLVVRACALGGTRARSSYDRKVPLDLAVASEPCRGVQGRLPPALAREAAAHPPAPSLRSRPAGLRACSRPAAPAASAARRCRGAARARPRARRGCRRAADRLPRGRCGRRRARAGGAGARAHGSCWRAAARRRARARVGLAQGGNWPRCADVRQLAAPPRRPWPTAAPASCPRRP
jgi:hypothetical protein